MRAGLCPSLVCATDAGASPAGAAKRPKETVEPPSAPDLLMDGGRKLSFERSFSLEREVKPKRSFWTRVVDVIAGQPDFHYLVSPYSMVTDSRGRIIVTDVAAAGVHIFDFAQQKYKFISRRDAGKDPMLTPQCVAVDAQDNIYVTDSQTGKIFVFDANGKYRRAIGSLKGGEGYFKRPTGIAVDSAAQRIYVTDTLRNKIFMMDMQGSVLQMIGKTGTGDGEFNYPTELRLEWAGSGGGRCHEFPRAGVRPLGHVPLCHRKDRRRRGMDVSSEGDWVRFRRASLCRRRSSGAWCRSSTSKGNCSITSAAGEPGRSSFNCRPACRSTSRIASTWWIPSTGGCRCFTTTASRKRRTGGSNHEDGSCRSPVC